MDYRLTRKDIVDTESYEAKREELIAYVAKRKENLRIPLGEEIVLVFEFQDSLVGAINELLRFENALTDEDVDNILSSSSRLMPTPDSAVCCIFPDSGRTTLHRQAEDWFRVTVAGNDCELTFSHLELESEPGGEVVPVICRVGIPESARDAFAVGPVKVEDTIRKVSTELAPEQRHAILETLAFKERN